MPGEAPLPPRRVFLSHTSELRGLPTPRSFVDAAQDAVTRAGHVVTDMAYFAAHDELPSRVSRRAVEESDVYVLIAGFRYGSRVPERPEVSHTEWEFEAATAAGLPRLVFLIDEGVRGTLGASEPEPRQDGFRARLCAEVTVATVAAPEGLEVALLQALMAPPELPGRRAWSVPALDDEVARPQLAEAAVAAVLAAGAAAAGGTVALVGAAGFGKTTLARVVAHDDRIRTQFPDGVVWVAVGEDTVGTVLADALVSAARLLDPATPAVSDPTAAGGLLGAALRGRRALLVVDDIWTSAQAEPFLIDTDRTVRLVTTRQGSWLPSTATRVPVDRMTSAESEALLTAGLDLSPGIVESARRVCGDWPLLLALVHGAVADEVRCGADADRELADVLAGLRADGITVLDTNDPGQRARAVAATLNRSIDRLTPEDRARFEELAVFGPGIAVPGDAVVRLWARTAGCTPLRARRLCRELQERSLLAHYRREPDVVALHDVVATYLRERVADRLPTLHRELVEAHREPGASWVDLDHADGYLLAWLPTHLFAAGLHDELRSLLGDRRWTAMKSVRLGLADLSGDLELADGTDEDTPEAARRLVQALTAASVAAVASDVSPELLAEMTTRGTWSVAWAVDAIARMSDEGRRSRALVGVLASVDSPVPDDTVETAWRVALELSTERRFAPLAALVPRLPEHRLGDALDAVNALATRAPRWEALPAAVALAMRVAVAGHRLDPWSRLPDLAYEHKMLLDGLRSIWNDRPGAAEWFLRALVEQLENHGIALLQHLAVVIPFLPSAAVDDVVDIVRRHGDRYCGDALVALARWAPPERLAAVVDLARDMGWEFPAPESEHQRPWVELMRAIGPRLPPPDRRAALDLAMTLRSDHAAQAVEELAPYLDGPTAAATLDGLENSRRWVVDDEREDRLVAAAALARRLPDPAPVMRFHLVASGRVHADLRVVLGRWDDDEPLPRNAAVLASFADILPDDTVRVLLRSLCRAFTWDAESVEMASPGLRRLAPRVAGTPALLRDAVALLRDATVLNPLFGDRRPPPREAVLAVLAPHLATADLAAALEVVLGGRVDPAAFETIAALGRHLPGPQRTSLADRSLAAAHRLRSDRHRVLALSGLAAVLPPDSARLALETIGANTRSVLFPVVVTALEAVLPHLAAEDLPRALAVFLDTPSVGNEDLRRLPRLFTDLDEERVATMCRLVTRCSSGPQADPHTWWLWDIAQFLPETLAVETWALVRTLPDPHERRALTACVVGRLPAAGKGAATDEVLALLSEPPNGVADRMRILAPLVAAVESDQLTLACRRLLADLDPYRVIDCWRDFLDLASHLPAEFTDQAMALVAGLSPGWRCELVRTFAPRMSIARRRRIAEDLQDGSTAGTDNDAMEQARALVAVSAGLPDEDRILVDVLDRATKRKWWALYRPVFLDLIPRLSGADRERAVTTAVTHCFRGYRIEGADELVGILGGSETMFAFGELASIRDPHARARVLATVMRRAGEAVDAAPALATVDVLRHIPAHSARNELLAIVTASAWWIDRQTGPPGMAAVAESILHRLVVGPS